MAHITDTSIDNLVRIHDDEPQAVAAALAMLARDGTVPEKDRVQFAWLCNHVVGEKEGRWPDALALQAAVIPHPASIAEILHRCVAELLNGHAVEAWALQGRLAQEHGATRALAEAATRLRVLQFVSAPVEQVADVLLSLVRSLQPWQPAGKFAPAMASSLNNVVSGLLDRVKETGVDGVVRDALLEGSRLSRAAWQEAGTWVNHERADYLIALCCNEAGEFDAAREAAEAGLALIEANGEEEVDRAFLLLEVARACKGKGDEAARDTARANAVAIASKWEDKGLKEWFEGNVKRA